MAAGLGVLVIATVVSDLPHHASLHDQTVAAAALVTQIGQDVASCSAGVSEATGIDHDLTRGSLTAGQRAQVPGLLRDDLSACSLTDDSLYQLASIEVPGSRAGKALGQASSAVLYWAYPDAFDLIQSITTFSQDGGGARLSAGSSGSSGLTAATTTGGSTLASRISRQEATLNSQRGRVAADLGRARTLLGGARLPGVGLADARD